MTAMTTIDNAIDNATQTPRWRYVAMVNTAYRVTTKVGMQWVEPYLFKNDKMKSITPFSPM